MSSSRYERSRSRSHRYREDYDYNDDYERRISSRSRSRSVDRYRRRHKRRDSRSRSPDYKRRHHHKHSRKHRDSRSYTRSRSRSRTSSHRSRKQHTRTRSRSNSRSSHRSYKLAHGQQSASRSPNRTTGAHQEKRRSRSHSTDDSKRHLSEEPTVRRIETVELEAQQFVDQENSSTQYFSSNTEPDLENLPLPEQTEKNNTHYEYYLEPEEPIDKERIHREMEEKLREALAKEGKIYPPPKPEASHPVFANDGSFLEIFKKMQEAQTMTAAASASTSSSSSSATVITMPTVASTYVTTPSYVGKPNTPAPPMVGRRRGGKILKTGLVAKPKAVSGNRDDKDFWSLYLAEVNKYKNNACELDMGNRPLLK